MNRVKCFDIASLTLDTQTKECAGQYCVNEDAVDFVRNFCSGLDKLVDNLFANEEENVGFSVDIDEPTMDIEFTVSCSHLNVEDKNDKFYELLLNAKSVTFSSNTQEDVIIIKFVVSGIWDLIGEE